MKTAISIPDELFAKAEAAARNLGLSRSKLFQIALEDFLKRRSEEALTAEINRNIEKFGDPADDEARWIAHGGRGVARLEREE